MIINDPQENYVTGFIKVYRSIQKHWIFSNSEYLRAWIIILMEVNYKDKKVLIHSDLLDCKRGESLNSLSTWAELFSSKKGKRWTVQNVRTFLKLLKNDSMISLKGERKTTRLTVCNYESYQSLLTDKQQTTNRQLTGSQQTTNNKQERKEVKKEKNNIEKRKTAFQKEVTEINSFYKIISDHLLNDMADGFLPYWTEMNKSKTKMKYEQEETFDIARRLHTWKRNAEKFGKIKEESNRLTTKF